MKCNGSFSTAMKEADTCTHIQARLKIELVKQGSALDAALNNKQLLNPPPSLERLHCVTLWDSLVEATNPDF